MTERKLAVAQQLTSVEWDVHNGAQTFPESLIL